MRPPWKLSTALGLAALFALVIAIPTRAVAATSGWLGVYTQSLNDGLRDGIGYDGDGVLVSGIESDSPADRAGIRKGDVIVSFNSRTVTSPSMLSDVVGAAKPGQNVSVSVWRHGTRQTLSVKVGERPADLDGSSRTGWDDDGDTPEPPTPPAPPRAPRTPEPGMYWMDRDIPGMPEMRRAMSMATRPRLGVQIQDLNSELGDYFGVSGGKGVLVTGVTDDTPASRAGMKAGDVIVKVGGTDVEDSGDLRDALRERPAGKVDITVMRKGQRVTVSPELAEPQKEFLPVPMGSGWKKTGPGEWSFDSPDTHKHIVIHRSDDSGDIHIITPRGDRHVILKENLDGDDDASKMDAEGRAEMQKQIDDLKQQVESLRGQLESGKTPGKSTTKTTTKGTGKSGSKTP